MQGGHGPPSSIPNLGPEVLYEYDLFGVICHEGQIDNGHYVSYARFEHEWYRFDDDKCGVLFYIKGEGVGKRERGCGENEDDILATLTT